MENVNPQWIIYLCLAAIIILYLLFFLFAIKLWRYATQERKKQQESGEIPITPKPTSKNAN
jgi:hypothetical protein